MPSAAGRGLVAVAGNKTGQRGGQRVRERGALRGGTKSNLTVDGERGQPDLRPFGLAEESGHLADYSGGQRNEIAGRQMIAGSVRIRRDLTESPGGNHVRRRGGDIHSFRQTAPHALA